MTSSEHPFTWRCGVLLDAFPLDIFSHKEAPLTNQIWFAVVQTAPRQARVLVATDLKKNTVRIITYELAVTCIGDEGIEASPEIQMKLNAATLHCHI